MEDKNMNTTKEFAEEMAKQKVEAKPRSNDEILNELKEMHKTLSQQILTTVKDVELLKGDPKHIDSFNMATMQIQAMNLFSYFMAIRIRMMELEKSAEQIKNNKEKADESNTK